jgi:hypothetical protein
VTWFLRKAIPLGRFLRLNLSKRGLGLSYAAVTDATLRAAAEAVSGNEPWQQTRKPAKAQT